MTGGAGATKIPATTPFRRVHVIGKYLRGIAVLALIGAVPATAGQAPSKYTLDVLTLKTWLPEQPAPGSASEAADIATFWNTRPIVQTPRGLEAAKDDVFDAQQVWERFASFAGAADGIQIESAAPAFVALTKKAQNNANALLAPIKVDIALGGRKRPFVVYPGAPSCLEPIDLVPGHRQADYSSGLPQSGSYPSGHAFKGMFWGLILSEILPEKADLLLRKGVSFGESRVVCGFHYESDVVAGRLAAAGMLAALHGNKEFRDDMEKAAREIRAIVAKK